VTQRLLRASEARARFSVGKTMFAEDIAPRLVRVQIGPRAVGYTESSVNRLITQMITSGKKKKKAA
jgi:predicted DNA-binding transcriptional regulator AlpA